MDSLSRSAALALGACLWVASAQASVSDLDISFCDGGVSSKRLELEADRLPWSHSSCIRYTNLGSAAVSASVSAADGFVLADGKTGCADASSDTGEFSRMVRYEGGATEFSLEPGASTQRTVVFDVGASDAAAVQGCLITQPGEPSRSGSGISIVVRRANIVKIAFSGSAIPTSSGSVVAETPTASGVAEVLSESGAAASAPEATVLPSRAESAAEAPGTIEAHTVEDRAPTELVFLASARDATVPAWIALLLAAAGFAAGSLVFRRSGSKPEGRPE